MEMIVERLLGRRVRIEGIIERRRKEGEMVMIVEF